MVRRSVDLWLGVHFQGEIDTYCDQEVVYGIYYRMGTVHKILCPVPALSPDLLFVNLADHA